MRRGDEILSLTIQTEERPSIESDEFEASAWGLAVKVITQEMARVRRLGENPEGVLVSGVQPGSPADEAEVRAGDVITLVDQHATGDLGSFEEVYAATVDAAPERILLTVRRVRTTQFLVLELRPPTPEE